MRLNDLILWQRLSLQSLEHACQISQPLFDEKITSTEDIHENHNLNHFKNNNKYLQKYFLFKNINIFPFQTVTVT